MLPPQVSQPTTGSYEAMKITDALEEEINKFLQESQGNPNKQLKEVKKCPKESQEKKQQLKKMKT